MSPVSFSHSFHTVWSSQKTNKANKELKNLPSFRIMIHTARLVASCLAFSEFYSSPFSFFLSLAELKVLYTPNDTPNSAGVILESCVDLLWAINVEVPNNCWLSWFDSISACAVGNRQERQMYRVSSWLYWSSLGVYQRRYTQRNTATLIFKERWARMRGNKRIIMPIYIHYSIDHRVTSTC